MRALRFQANLPIYFWGESVLAAAHLINRTPSPFLQNKSPYEILFNKPPSYDTIRIFGCLCFAQNQKSKGDKFASRSRKCIFVGYPFGQKGWKLFDLDSKVFFVSRDVKFFEDELPFVDPTTSNIDPEHIVPLFENIHYDFTACEDDSCGIHENIEVQNLVQNENGNAHFEGGFTPQREAHTSGLPTQAQSSSLPATNDQREASTPQLTDLSDGLPASNGLDQAQQCTPTPFFFKSASFAS